MINGVKYKATKDTHESRKQTNHTLHTKHLHYQSHVHHMTHLAQSGICNLRKTRKCVTKKRIVVIGTIQTTFKIFQFVVYNKTKIKKKKNKMKNEK